jgi:hypothetical protein
MRSIRYALLTATVLTVVITSAHAVVPPYIRGSSTVAGRFNWGSDSWTPYHEYRYVETGLSLFWTIDSLSRPTHLNIHAVYSQVGGSCDVDVYIDTVDMCSWDERDPHHHGSWWNSGTKTGGHYVGRFTAEGTDLLFSFDVDSWIQDNPPTRWDTYYVVLDQLDDPNDVAVHQVWLGAAGYIGTMVQEPFPKARVHSPTAEVYPNPSFAGAVLHYVVDSPGKVNVKVYDVSGNLVRVIILGEMKDIGEHSVVWDGRDYRGAKVASGTYFYELEVGGARAMRKSLLIR